MRAARESGRTATGFTRARFVKWSEIFRLILTQLADGIFSGRRGPLLASLRMTGRLSGIRGRRRF
jgi:hypothetical protein